MYKSRNTVQTMTPFEEVNGYSNNSNIFSSPGTKRRMWTNALTESNKLS